jgi:hypothetical protein
LAEFSVVQFDRSDVRETGFGMEATMKIGVVIMLAESQLLKRAPTFGEIRKMALLSEELGFDSIW